MSSTFLPIKFRSLTGNIFVLLVACVCWQPLKSQQVTSTKSPLQLADQYYAAGEYYTAGNLYQQYLSTAGKSSNIQAHTVYAKKGRIASGTTNTSRTDILYKQAESYRLANYWLNADSAYKKCTDNIDALYWSAVCERSVGKYDEAEQNIRKYLSASGTKKFKEAAEKELQTLQYVRSQLAVADSAVQVKKIKTPDSHEKGAFAVVPAGGNQYLISSTQADSVGKNKVNPYHSHLMYATLNNDSLAQLTPVVLPGINKSLDNQGAASFSADGQRIYYTQWRKENGRIVSSIYSVNKQSNGNWSAPVLLPKVNAGLSNNKQPFCTADGKYLFFASDRTGGSGGFDIWYASLNADGSTGDPVNAGAVINTTGDEQAPFYQVSGSTLVYSTNGKEGMGGYDLFSAKGSEATWSTPNNLGYPVNSSRDDIYFFAPERTALLANAMVGSDRGSGCCLESYRITKIPSNKRLTGVVRDNESNEPLSDAEIVFTDPAGITRKATTNTEGKYVFDTIENAEDFTISISKSFYNDTTAIVKITNTDKTSKLTDQVFNTDVVIEKKRIKPENVVTIFFDFDRSKLKKEALNKLDSIYNILMQYPNAKLQISAYTDGKGTEQYNKKLSDRRARACADYFIRGGIVAKRITFEAFGACCPIELELIDGRDNPDGRSRNRRALINISKE